MALRGATAAGVGPGALGLCIQRTNSQRRYVRVFIDGEPLMRAAATLQMLRCGSHVGSDRYGTWPSVQTGMVNEMVSEFCSGSVTVSVAA